MGTASTSEKEFVQNDLKSAVPPPKNSIQKSPIAIIDTGGTGHCLDPTAEPRCSEVQHTKSGPSVQVANGENIETTKRAIVPLATELSEEAKTGHIFNSLQSGSLISIGQLCDDDCVALFTKCKVKIIKDGKVIILGTLR